MIFSNSLFSYFKLVSNEITALYTKVESCMVKVGLNFKDFDKNYLIFRSSSMKNYNLVCRLWHLNYDSLRFSLNSSYKVFNVVDDFFFEKSFDGLIYYTWTISETFPKLLETSNCYLIFCYSFSYYPL
jgi:hypothetical protein